MKKIIFTLAGFCFITGIIAQPLSTAVLNTSKIKLENGKKLLVVTNISLQGDFGMGMQISSSSVSENILEVKNSAADNYTISNTLTKIKTDMTMMGQNNSYDSENKAFNNEEMAKLFEEKLNKPIDIIIDNKTGLAIAADKKVQKTDADLSNPAANLMNMFGDASDDGVVSAAFEIIPQGKKINDSWSDTAKEKDMKTIRTYTLKSITGNDAVLQVDINSTATNKLDFQGMEFEIKTKTKTKSEILTDINTSLVKQKTSASEITGSFQMMGQDMPITAKVNSSSTFK